MTETEFAERWRRYETMQPGVCEWLRLNSPDAKQTIREWGYRFERIPADILDAVLRSISMGYLPPPRPYEVGPLLANYCERIMQDRERDKRQAAGRREYTKPLGDYFPAKEYFSVCSHFYGLAREMEWDTQPGLAPVGTRQREWVQSQIIQAGLEPGERETEESYRAKRIAAGIPEVARRGIKTMADLT